MTHTLPQVAHEHHARILASVNQFPAMADALLEHGGVAVQPELATTRDFLNGTLLPHMAASERSVYPELERMLQNRHSMAPLRREHEEIRALVSRFSTLVADLHGTPIGLASALAIRRVLFHLYTLLKIHLAEEEAYLHIVDHGVPEDVGELLAAAMEHPIG
jgi:iron-sulfur cluster repair protein YtfE (RIC family)